MNVYLISQTENYNYDTYDSAVVIAESEEQARLINPEHTERHIEFLDNPLYRDWDAYSFKWATSPDNVTVKYIGKVDESYTEPCVICASFNAGKNIHHRATDSRMSIRRLGSLTVFM
jgi:hypothetical protein